MNREQHLNWIYYDTGKQPGSFKLTYSFRGDDGEHRFTKHLEFLEYLEEKNLWKLTKVNHRSVLKNELVLDIDTKTTEEATEIMKTITDRLKNEFDAPFRCFFTGSKGYHIHMYTRKWFLMSREERELEKTAIINALKCDGMKAFDKTMIALEFTPHWKTGKKKELVMEYGLWE